jgi:hypothetical protein
MPTRIVSSLFVAALVFGQPIFAEEMRIEKQVKLSPGHSVEPSHIVRASNGDFIVYGSNSAVNFRPWATRVMATGEVRWEFLQGGGDYWNDRSERGQRFDTAVELPDQSTLLCGINISNNQRSVLLDRLSVDGELLDEHVIHPDWSKGPLTSVNCVRWNDGIALIGGLAASPAGTGWFAKLDKNLNPEWQQFGNEYIATSGDVMEMPAGGFLYLNPSQQDAKGRRASAFFRMSSTGEITARHIFSGDDDPYLIYPAIPRSDVYVALSIDTFNTQVIHLDDQLHGPTRVIKLHNAGIRKCLELQDGSLAIFGSQFHGIASPAVTRVYMDGSAKAFLVEPSRGSPWYIDAVPTGNPKEFAAVRLSNATEIVLDWVSFK